MTHATNPPPRISFEGLTVDFGASRAVDHVTLSAVPGEIIGLLGHNGAGKSTVVNVATGAIGWTSGEIRIDGEPIPAGSTPRDIARIGVTVVHQEPALVPNLSILDNLELGRPAHGSRRERAAAAQAALERVGTDLPLDLPVATLSLGERQSVDLARGVLEGEIRVLFLDEPTAALGAEETAALHALIRSFAAAGAVVFYVSHRLPDILDVCTRIAVMNTGRLVMDQPAAGLRVEDLSEALAPGIVRAALVSARRGTLATEIEYGDRHLTAHRGEVVGLFGMAASDQFHLLESLYGLRADESRHRLEGRPYAPSDPSDALRRGVFYVPADRERDGLLSTFSARDNVLFPWYGHLGAAGWITPQTGGDLYERSRELLEVRGPAGDVPVSEFSGGNRQKHLLARWMFPQQPEVLLLAQPTQGVDVGAKVDIVRAIRALAEQGSTVLVASAESDEITSMCDRAYVLYGRRSAELHAGSTLTDEALLDTLLRLAGDSHSDEQNEVHPS
ncbi:sugar ABC transporter ATP-binding protein [Microbacterium sp. NPDC077184]|uniref:sugar ABC transporter ATP-binding protein n=1 Tax=Microbacterium sp. NPDC077184 TaxID=3154764 RepID=UPI00344791AD